MPFPCPLRRITYPHHATSPQRQPRDFTARGTVRRSQRSTKRNSVLSPSTDDSRGVRDGSARDNTAAATRSSSRRRRGILLRRPPPLGFRGSLASHDERVTARVMLVPSRRTPAI